MYNYGSYIFASFLIGVSLSIQLTATHAFTITPTTTTTTATRYYNSAANTAVVTTYNSRSRSIRNNRRASLQQQRLQPLGVVSRNGLIYEDIEIGTGRNIFPGDSILCYYIGTYQSTTKGGNNPFSNNNKKVTFDETDAGEPAEIVVGVGNSIPGWEIGICGDSTLDIPPMKIGGDRKLIIPAGLAYGELGAGDGVIPPNTDLEFQIEIINAERKSSGVSSDTKLKGFAGLVGFLTFSAILTFIVTKNIYH